MSRNNAVAYYHLPGLFEFYELYKVFLPLWREHREYFYDWCDIASIYGSPADCIWGGGRAGFGDADADQVFSLMDDYQISPRLTFSNSLLEEKHLSDRKCNSLCERADKSRAGGGVIIHSPILASYLREKYPSLYLVSSTTKVLTDFEDLRTELENPLYSYVVPDFRLNKDFVRLSTLDQNLKDKVEFLCNECCPVTCRARKACYESVSRKNLGQEAPDHHCPSVGSSSGYRFSSAMKNPAFIGVSDIKDTYLPAGFTNFKIEGRGLGSALVLEFLLHYMTKPEQQLAVREAVYLDAMLDLF